MIVWLSASGVCGPKFIVPRHTRLTTRPRCPTWVYSMRPSLRRARVPFADGAHTGGAGTVAGGLPRAARSARRGVGVAGNPRGRAHPGGRRSHAVGAARTGSPPAVRVELHRRRTGPVRRDPGGRRRRRPLRAPAVAAGGRGRLPGWTPGLGARAVDGGPDRRPVPPGGGRRCRLRAVARRGREDAASGRPAARPGAPGDGVAVAGIARATPRRTAREHRRLAVGVHRADPAAGPRRRSSSCRS